MFRNISLKCRLIRPRRGECKVLIYERRSYASQIMYSAFAYYMKCTEGLHGTFFSAPYSEYRTSLNEYENFCVIFILRLALFTRSFCVLIKSSFIRFIRGSDIIFVLLCLLFCSRFTNLIESKFYTPTFFKTCLEK